MKEFLDQVMREYLRLMPHEALVDMVVRHLVWGMEIDMPTLEHMVGVLASRAQRRPLSVGYLYGVRHIMDRDPFIPLDKLAVLLGTTPDRLSDLLDHPQAKEILGFYYPIIMRFKR